MTREPVLARMRDILAKHFQIPPHKVTDDATFRGALGMDSFATVDLILHLGKEFDIPTDAEDFAELYTVGEVADYILRLKSNQPEEA